MSRRLFALLALACLPPLASAQDPQAPARIERARAALAVLAPLVGMWEGEASIVVGRGTTRILRQHEDVTWGSMGTVLIVRGTGRSTEAANAGAIEFEATAIIWFDEESGRIRMRAHRDGRFLDPELEIRPDTLIWGFAVPGGRVRYTTAFGDDVWHEVGEFIREGAAPIRTFDMRLPRTVR